MLRFTTAAVITLAADSAGTRADKPGPSSKKQLQAGDTALIRDRDTLGTAVAEYASMVNELDSVLRTSRRVVR